MTERYRNIYTRRISRTKGERERPAIINARSDRANSSRKSCVYVFTREKCDSFARLSIEQRDTFSPFPPLFLQGFFTRLWRLRYKRQRKLCNTPRCERGLSRVCFALATSSKRERELSFLPSFLPFLLPLYFFDAHTERISSYPLGKK